jgi:hypothetical protein
MDGDAGNDLLRSRDGEPDSLRWTGVDVARIDDVQIDQVHQSCEKVRTDLV